MSGPDFATVLAGVVADLTHAGIAATADAGDVRYPGVWAGGVSADLVTYGGTWEYQVDLYLVDQVDGDMRAYAALDDLAGKVAQLWPTAEGKPIEVTSVSLPSAPNVPAYRYPITITHEETP